MPGVAGRSYRAAMDTLLSVLVWGGLILVVLSLVNAHGASRGPGPDRTVPPGGGSGAARPDGAASSQAPAPPVGPRGPSFVETPRESEALADGLVIGHFLTRHHYEERIGELEAELGERSADARESWEFGGEGADPAGGGFEDGVGFDEFDALSGHSVEPWYDDFLGLDDDEE